MNALPGKLAALTLCGVMIGAEWRRGYFSRVSRWLRQRDVWIGAPALGVSAVLAALVLLVDTPLQAAIQGIRVPAALQLIRIGGWLGQGTALWFILLAAYALALCFRRAAVKTATFGCMVSAALATMLSSILKWCVARARPNAQLGPLAFFHWSEALHNRSRFQSFPSGDTVIVAAVAWYLASRHPKAPLAARALLLLLPLATACSRVLLNKHWPSDTVFSIGLALAAAQCVTRYETFSGVR